MIQINSTQYDNCQIQVTWSNFAVFKNDQKCSGKAPFIAFHLANNISIGLELTFSEAMFLNTPINVKTNIQKHISDITFEDDEGWTSLILGKYDCNITRIDEKTFCLDFYIEESKINILINENIALF